MSDIEPFGVGPGPTYPSTMYKTNGGSSSGVSQGPSPEAERANELRVLYNNNTDKVYVAGYRGKPKSISVEDVLAFDPPSTNRMEIFIKRPNRFRRKYATPYRVMIRLPNYGELEVAMKFWEEIAQANSNVREHVITRLPRTPDYSFGSRRQLLKQIFWELWNFGPGDPNHLEMFKALD